MGTTNYDDLEVQNATVSGTLSVAGDIVPAGGVGTTVTLTASLPAAADSQGKIYTITDDGVGDDEVALVWSDGTDWLKVTTTALT